MKNKGTWSDATGDLVDRYTENRAAVIDQAIKAMCEHYRCTSADLSLCNAHQPAVKILKKDTPGLAYLIKRIVKGGEWFTVAEPVYLEKEEDGGV